MQIITFQPFRDFEGMPADKRARAFARAERKFDLMQELGCDLLLVCSNVSPDSLGGIDRAAADLHELGERAAKRGLRVGFEALAWGRHINDYRDAWEAVRRADHPAVGLVLDSFHTLARKTDLKAMRSIPRDRIFLVQVADAPVLDMDSLSWSRHFRNFPGPGRPCRCSTSWRRCRPPAIDGLLSLEIFNDQFRAGSARSVAVDGHRSLLYLLDQLRARTGVDAASAARRCRRARDASAPSSSSSPSTRTATPRFEALLRGLGLRAGRRAQVESGDAMVAGRHQPRRQHREGRLRALLQHHARHLRVRHRPHGRRCRRDARSRADACSTSRSARPSAPASWKSRRCAASAAACSTSSIPRATWRAVWDVEFEPTGEDAAKSGAGLTTVDHISQSMHYEEMLTWLLFYTSLLDLAKTPEQDVLDPGGLVKSQVVQSADGGAAHRAQRLAVARTRCRRASCRRPSAPACSTSPSPPTTSSRPSRA